MHLFLEAHVADYMTRSVVTVTPDTPLRGLEQRFAQYDFNGFPVLEGGVLSGVVTKFDVLKVFAFTPDTVLPHYDELSRLTAGQIMTRSLITFSPQVPLTRVLQALVEYRVKSFPVVEGGKLVGIIAREDVVRALHAACSGDSG